MKAVTVRKILNQTVANYDALHEVWNRTRQDASNLVDFLTYVKPGDQVLDVGCGNARLLKLLSSVNVGYIGIDNSSKMIETAQRNFPSHRFLQADITSLPIADASHDVTFCIATLHHVPSKALREQAVAELARVTKPGGIVIINNWHYTSPHFLPKAISNGCKRLVGLTDFDFGDVEIGWGGTEIQRYVHLFTKRGMINLARRHGFQPLVCRTSTPSQRRFRNLVYIGQKMR